MMKERGRREASRRRVTGELRLAQREFERATICNLAAANQQVRASGKELLHFDRRPEMKFAIETLFRMFLPQQCQSADALDDVILPAVCRAGVVNRE